MNTTPAGSSSATCTSVAVDGPPFDTASVQVTTPPPTAPADVLTIFMSTAGPTLVCAVSVLFADTGSPWSPETVAAFVSVWSPRAAGTRTRIVAVCVAPTASAPTAHVTVCAAAVQPAPDTNVVPAGSVSAISSRGVARAVVRHGERVVQLVARGHRGRRRLVDAQVGGGIDLDHGVVRVVRRVRLGRRGGGRRHVDSCRPCRAGARSCASRSGRAGAHRSRSPRPGRARRAVGAGARGHERRAGRERVAHGDAGRVGGPAVVDGDRVGHRAALQHARPRGVLRQVEVDQRPDRRRLVVARRCGIGVGGVGRHRPVFVKSAITPGFTVVRISKVASSPAASVPIAHVTVRLGTS